MLPVALWGLEVKILRIPFKILWDPSTYLQRPLRIFLNISTRVSNKICIVIAHIYWKNWQGVYVLLVQIWNKQILAYRAETTFAQIGCPKLGWNTNVCKLFYKSKLVPVHLRVPYKNLAPHHLKTTHISTGHSGQGNH